MTPGALPAEDLGAHQVCDARVWVLQAQNHLGHMALHLHHVVEDEVGEHEESVVAHACVRVVQTGAWSNNPRRPPPTRRTTTFKLHNCQECPGTSLEAIERQPLVPQSKHMGKRLRFEISQERESIAKLRKRYGSGDRDGAREYGDKADEVPDFL